MDNIEVVDVDSLYAEFEACKKRAQFLSRRIAEQKLGSVQRTVAEAQKHIVTALEMLKSITAFLGPETVDLETPIGTLLAAKVSVSRCHSSLGDRLNDINRAKTKEA